MPFSHNDHHHPLLLRRAARGRGGQAGRGPGEPGGARGSTVRIPLFWRYLLAYRKPVTS
ncbi:hypothetical protein [Amycolatopsis aidingensis]|uniref:hypothetical protein n=1 Tax=Amycolatopsis aidingensis TaxID=2842453 RepID=UPI001C0C720A|nr:hypothetical protein [Amycolatopsis aidingensis]